MAKRAKMRNSKRKIRKEMKNVVNFALQNLTVFISLYQKIDAAKVKENLKHIYQKFISKERMNLKWKIH